MNWTRPEPCTKKQLNKAGKILAKEILLEDLENQTRLINIFQNWRASHAYPMHIIMMTLKKLARNIDDSAICVQRLKRAPSVVGKLQRYTTTLSQIQDIAGCRVVVSNVKLARKVSEEYISRNRMHKRIKKREMNYINNPKPDGYRSIHLVYEYQSKNKGQARLHNGQKVEIQIRSQLQHI